MKVNDVLNVGIGITLKGLRMEDFQLFQSEFKKWQEKFGLTGWQVYFKKDLIDGCFADISFCHGLQVATVRLNDKLPDKDKPFRDIKKDARHEALHLLLARLEGNAKFRYASENEITESIEELVVKLEGLISK